MTYKLEQARLTGFIEERDRTIEGLFAEIDSLSGENRSLKERAEDMEKYYAGIRDALAQKLNDTKALVEETTDGLRDMEARKNEMEIQCADLRDKIAALERELEELKKSKPTDAEGNR